MKYPFSVLRDLARLRPCAAVQNMKDPFSILRDLACLRPDFGYMKDPFSILRDLACLRPDFGLRRSGSVCELYQPLASGLVNRPSKKFTQERDLVSEINCRAY